MCKQKKLVIRGRTLVLESFLSCVLHNIRGQRVVLLEHPNLPLPLPIRDHLLSSDGGPISFSQVLVKLFELKAKSSRRGFGSRTLGTWKNFPATGSSKRGLHLQTSRDRIFTWDRSFPRNYSMLCTCVVRSTSYLCE